MASGGKTAKSDTKDLATLADAGEMLAAWSLDIKDPPWVVGEKKVAKVKLAPLNLVKFEEVIRNAELARTRARSDNNRKYFTREKVKACLRAEDAQGNAIALTEQDVLAMPRRYAAEITEVAGLSLDPPGEVIGDGDGFKSPILYRLGTPLKLADGEISELEFTMKTYGDVEDILCSENMPQQVLAALKASAKPIGTGSASTLQVLPSWAVEQMTLADGLAIGDKVLPSFFL
ncbi:MAG: hypothetical protein ACRCYS_17025 [Beijerinckiaceae bacterium]